MNFFMPEIGQQLLLEADWTFTLHNERRNSALWELLTGEEWNWRTEDKQMSCTIPAGTTLKVVRIYIRSGKAAFSSITFSTDKPKQFPRFWAKLEDCNNKIQFRLSDEQPWYFGVRDQLLVGNSVEIRPKCKGLGEDVQSGEPLTVVPYRHTAEEDTRDFHQSVKVAVLADGVKVKLLIPGEGNPCHLDKDWNGGKIPSLFNGKPPGSKSSGHWTTLWQDVIGVVLK